jgi:hypothetical protein
MRGQALFAAIISTLLMGTGLAGASTVTVDGNYTISYVPDIGNGPKITDDLKGSFSKGLKLGGPASSESSFFTTSPAGSSGLCGGRGQSKCNSSNDTVSGLLDVTFTFPGVTGSFLETAEYQADYDGQLSCSSSKGKQTDCIDWTGAINGALTFGVTFSSGALKGDLLDVTLYDAQDWAITPKISFELFPPSTHGGGGVTPIPSSLPLFAAGLGLITLFSRRRRARA